MSTKRRIAVAGSLNMDLVQRVSRLPQLGETIHGAGMQSFAGGKGANQAYAAARLDADVFMVGCVGYDDFGAALVVNLQSAGVNTHHVIACGHPTGTAHIFVTDDGSNAIVISAGANAALRPEATRLGLSELQAGDVLLCQLESPGDAVLAALETAKSHGATTVLDPAPSAGFDPAWWPLIDYLTPNEIEAADILGRPGTPIRDEREGKEAAEALHRLSGKAIVVKLGKHGCWFTGEGESLHVPGHAVEAVDSVAAGDTFNAAFAARLAEGAAPIEALRFANAAAALSVQKSGAQDSAPERAEVDELLGNA
jgi:ribokinase